MYNEKKEIFTGVEDFKKLIDDNGYLVDKTLLIKELLEKKAMVTLFTRPRRFGKTLNQSMIRRFLEDEITEQGERVDNRYLFDGLAISSCGEDILKHQQRYPVIFLSLKSAKQKSYDLAYGEIKKRISEEFKRHKYVLDGNTMSEEERDRFKAICNVADNEGFYLDSIAFLSQCLAKYHNCKAFILLDEYDVPLENAYTEGFYDEMIGFVRSLFESALKTNPYLEKGIITGCLRISKESIFTGLNNLEVDTVLHTRYSSGFGFTEDEVKTILEYYDLGSCISEVRKWYDGYLFGGSEIYNPWSILKYVTDHNDKVTEFPLPYWSNTSSNSIVREMIYNADNKTKNELETLMAGGTIEKPVHEDITYEDIHASMDNLWNFLFFTGYLKAGRQRTDGETLYIELAIPNTEIKTIYRQSIMTWFDKNIEKTDRGPLIKALEQGDCKSAEDFISSQLMDTISYFDYAENYYHGFIAGLLSGTDRYIVRSNRESGSGRPDIVMTEKKFMGRAIILELKISETFKGMESKCSEALEQIEDRQYAVPLEDDGYQEILKYAVCFFKKGCIVRMSSSDS